MSRESLDKFKKAILKNSNLQERLKQANDQESFIELAVRLGQENGYSFTTEEIEASIQEQNQKLTNMTFGEKAIDQIMIENKNLLPRGLISPPPPYWGFRG